MSIDLQKKSSHIAELLAKKGVHKAPTMRAAAALDISGSMGNIIRYGKLQLALNQLMGPAMQFDDNGELDVFKFDDRCEYVGTCSPQNYETFIEDKGIKARGATAYSPIITEGKKFFFEQKKSGFFGFGKSKPVDNTPVLMMIVTDGEPARGDISTTLRMMQEHASDNIYYHLVGVGGDRSSFPTIAMLADKLDNVGEVYLQRFDMTDEEVYAQLISDELVDFVKSHCVSV
jgi:hypothetical protein